MQDDKSMTVVLNKRDSIEFGGATLDTSARSVRNRYNNKDGIFSPRGSSEIPLRDLPTVVIETAKNDWLKPARARQVIEALEASIDWQHEAGGATDG